MNCVGSGRTMMPPAAGTGVSTNGCSTTSRSEVRGLQGDGSFTSPFVRQTISDPAVPLRLTTAVWMITNHT